MNKLKHKYLCINSGHIGPIKVVSGNVVSVKHTTLMPENVKRSIFCITFFYLSPYLTSCVIVKETLSVILVANGD